MIRIELSINDDGSIKCEAWRITPGPLSHNDTLTVIGMLESAKMAFLAGRWSVLDSEKKAGVGCPPLITEDFGKKPSEGKPAVNKEETK